MWLRCLGFALLVWIPAVLHAQLNCSAPILDDGYFIPTHPHYPNGEKIFYSCDKRHKPVVEGWWATSICQNGEWVHKPECIDETACILPTIPNAKPSQSPKVCYKDRAAMQVDCKEGYEGSMQITCTNGNWTSLPVCGKSSQGCTKPPKLPDAVIINQHDEVFPDGLKVRYQCRQGYAMAGGKTEASILCKAGNWQAGEVCKVSTGSTSKDKETSPSITTIDRCGAFPVVQDGDIIQVGQRSLKFQCAVHYKLVGPETVECYSNGRWSKVPTCRANYCSVNTEEYTDLENTGVKYITNGHEEKLDCVDKFIFRNYALVECNNGIPKIYQCCNNGQINTGICWLRGEMTN